MINLILTALAPVAFVVLLGFLAGKTKLIGSDGAKSLSTAVVNFALPCALFVSIFGFSPSQFENIPYVLTLLIGITLPFFVALFLGLFVWKKPPGEAALFGSNSGFPDMAYFGLPVVLTVVGQQGMLPIIVGNIITSIIVIPIIMAMLNKEKGTASGAAATPGLGSILLNTIKQPVVWAPILGLILALLGFKLPALATDSLKLLGNVSGGLALFTLGILLSFLTPRIDLQVVTVVIVKNFLMPALVLVLALAFKLDPLLAKGAIIIVACPAATMGAMLSSQFAIATDKIPGQILASNVVAIFTMAMWIFIAEKLF
ncbi:AEC family transporter [Orrella daihaiensis]|uniref:AEC family transporter n=1 Tax=Orrella daihaiensis TaxID=2782176 RepID=A0ABY4ALX7_9BURK|nr:AEC family transporter [Orrella daihaiensis]UOD51283.1 AEC family transporter [Orrella daihaiensis]